MVSVLQNAKCIVKVFCERVGKSGIRFASLCVLRVDSCLSYRVTLSCYLIIARRSRVRKGEGLVGLEKALVIISEKLWSIYPWARMHGTSETHLSWRSVSILRSISRLFSPDYLIKTRIEFLYENTYLFFIRNQKQDSRE